MFWTVKTPFLIICILILDLLLIGDIIDNNKTQVLGVNISSSPTPTPTKVIIKKPVRKIIKKATPTPIKINKAIVIATKTPTPSAVATTTPISPTQAPSTSDLLQQINNFRSTKGLAGFTSNSETCFFANIRSQEIISNFNHDGFTNRVNSKTLPYPSYSSVAENIAMNSDSNKVVQAWIDSPGHYANLIKDVPFACVVGNGKFYVFEAWKP